MSTERNHRVMTADGVSIGATVANPAVKDSDLEPERLLADADHALYAAKSGGRDTVTISHLSAA